MADILDKILADKRAEVVSRQSQTNLEKLKQQVRSMPRCRNFYKAVTKPSSRGINVIAEVKKASPSAGLIRENFNPVTIAQTYEKCGADAILLIAEALRPSELMDLMIAAAELTLTVLLEVHQADSLLEVRSMIGFPKKGYSVLGINNRDLTTMQVDLNTTSRLAGLLDNRNELVAESGIKTRADVEKLMSTGVKAVLIGQTLCEHPDIEEKFTELFG